MNAQTLRQLLEQRDGHPDWTLDPKSGRTNSSPLFESLVAEVARLIRGEAHALVSGDTESVARLIMAQLAHKHHLVPAGLEGL